MTKSAEKKRETYTDAHNPLKNTTTTSTMNEIDEIEKKRQRTHIRKRWNSSRFKNKAEILLFRTTKKKFMWFYCVE